MSGWRLVLMLLVLFAVGFQLPRLLAPDPMQDLNAQLEHFRQVDVQLPDAGHATALREALASMRGQAEGSRATLVVFGSPT